MHEENQGAIFVADNRKVGIRTKHIDINHQFLRYMDKEKYIGINYINGEENHADIMTKNCSGAKHIKHTKRITEGELWGIVKTGMENVKNDQVMDGVIDYDST